MGDVDQVVSDETWSRLMHEYFPVNGLCARVNGKMAAIMHYILHPVTGMVYPVCYMQDLYVDPAFRRQGLAKKLLAALEETGKNENWGRIYWLAEMKNEAAQALYKSIGHKLPFNLFVLPL